MKKFIAILLALALLLCGPILACAMAETAEATPRAAPLVDLTGAFVAIMLVVFDFLLAWIARVMIPPIKEWLETHTTQEQRGLLWDAICKLVDAAEQTIRGPGMGAKRLAYVEAGLIERGFSIDNDLIEAAVKRMKDRTGLVLGEAFDVAPLQFEEAEVEASDDAGTPTDQNKM